MPVKPTGGVRVIYNYVNVLNSIGADAYVLHPLKNYSYKFADSPAPIYKLRYIFSNDHLVIPDVYIGRINKDKLNGHSNFSLLIQNPYIIRSIQKYNNKEIINKVFNSAKYILCISEDAERMIANMFPQVKDRLIRSSWSLPDNSKLKFNPKDKQKIISFMPRKNIDHIQLTLDSIDVNLPNDWQLVPIVNMTRSQLEDILNRSSIHLSFGSFEGLPAPPVEAAISGNYVIGYHGNGGREYWLIPNFTEVNVCDIYDFSKKILERVSKIDSNPEISIELHSGISKLKLKFSSDFEYECLNNFYEKLQFLNSKINGNLIIKTPFTTNYIFYQVDRVLVKFKQLSYGL
jgi:hypothetical protein